MKLYPMALLTGAIGGWLEGAEPFSLFIQKLLKVSEKIINEIASGETSVREIG